MMWTDCTPTLLKLNERFVVVSITDTTSDHVVSNRCIHYVRRIIIIFDRQENCSACSQVPQDLQFPPSAKLQEVLEYLTENASL